MPKMSSGPGDSPKRPELRCPERSKAKGSDDAEFFLAEQTPDKAAPSGEYIHLAFVAKSQDEVDQVYAAAL